MRRIRHELPIIAFESQEAWDAWLAAQHNTSKGLWLKLAKKSSGIASVSQQEAIETALCYGWIDGQLDKFDNSYWLVRFTPRTRTSKWSEVNRTKAMNLIKQGRMKAAGLKEIEQGQGRWAMGCGLCAPEQSIDT